MSSLANHMRITGLQFTDGDISSRQAAIASLKTAWTKHNTFDFIFSKSADIATALGGDGMPSEALGAEVEKALQKKAPAFLYTERPLEVGIVAGMAAVQMVAAAPDASGWLISDVWAAALWLALGFQPSLDDTKREALRASVLNAARERSATGANLARQRVVVPDFGAVSLTAGGEDKLGTAIRTATGPTIEALRRNAALDREELDFLWWAQLRRSRLLKRPFDGIEEIVRVVAAGIEGAEYLRRMPCEVHREIVLRTLEANPILDLAGVLDAIGPDRETLAAIYLHKPPTGGAALFPLLTAIITGVADDTPAAKMARNAEEWGARALVEAALLKMRVTGAGKL